MDSRNRKCYICWHNDRKIVVAVAKCNEHGWSVCEKHAAGCVEDGHGYRPFPEDA